MKGSTARISMAGLVLVAAVAAGAVGAAHGYPISPRTLWEQAAEAELIVVADVVAIHELATDENEWNDAAAVLDLREIWKGSAASIIEVVYPQGLLCPAPPRFVVGERVLAFLGRDQAEAWYAVGLSYGTLYPDDAELADFRAATESALELQAVRQGLSARRQRDLRIEWLVEAASRPGTRWHGLYELHPQSDGLHSYYDRSRPRLAGRPALRAEQLQRIARGFTHQPPLDRTLPMALGVLDSLTSPKVDQAAAAAIATLVAREQAPYWIRDALMLLLRRLGDEDPAARIAVLGELHDRVETETLRGLWRQITAQYRLGEVEPLADREPRVGGVGSDTPS